MNTLKNFPFIFTLVLFKSSLKSDELHEYEALPEIQRL